MTTSPSPYLPANALEELVARFAAPGAALGLLGSHARGEAGPHSDVDLLLLVPDGAPMPPATSHLVDGRLVTVNPSPASAATAWFEQPSQIVQHVGGLRLLWPLRDPAGQLATLRERARAFSWTPALQQRADRWVGDAMTGWAEEVLRGLGGLETDDVGRLLLARFGLSWGLSRLMLVHERLLPVSESSMLRALSDALGEGSAWIGLQRTAFGLATSGATPSLRDQVAAGVRLYRETAKRVDHVLEPDERAIVEAVVGRSLSSGVLGPPAS